MSVEVTAVVVVDVYDVLKTKIGVVVVVAVVVVVDVVGCDVVVDDVDVFLLLSFHRLELVRV